MCDRKRKSGSSSELDKTEMEIVQHKRMRSSACCVGSSHEFLILSDYDLVPVLLDPLTATTTLLPPLGITRTWQKTMGGGVAYDYYDPITSKRYFYVSNQTELRAFVLKKAILSENPCRGNNYAVVVLIFNQIRIWKHGERSWTVLDGKLEGYHDIICHENFLYAINKRTAIECWDLTGSSPVRKMQLDPPFPGKVKETDYPSCEPRFYLAESGGRIFMVVRYVCDCVDEVGSPVDEIDWEWDWDSCSYGTVSFHVFKLDKEKTRWEELKSLEDSAIFLGGNHTVMVSSDELEGCERNCIYFTDDNWVRMRMRDDVITYGGDDVGVFTLGAGYRRK